MRERFTAVRALVAAALVVVAVLALETARAGIEPKPLARSQVTIATGAGPVVFNVEMAVTWRERAQGLQRRHYLAPDAGMLFDFGKSEPVVMWMKDTPLPLDILFITADGRILSIAERTRPLSTEMIPSRWPVRAVLEVNAGTVARHHILPGDRVIHPIFEDAKAE